MLQQDASDAAGGSENEAGLDDSAMFRMDGVLAAMLRQGVSAKPNTQENKEHLRYFKIRFAMYITAATSWFTK